MPEQERVRKYPRFGLGADSAIWSKVWQGQINEATPVGGVLTLLGAGGAFVEVSETYDVGSQVGLRFVLPGARDEIACESSCQVAASVSSLSISRQSTGNVSAPPRCTSSSSDRQEAPRRDRVAR
jgi:hypothetical protein